MSGTEADVRAAQAQAERAKRDFSNTLHELQSRLSPKRIASDALHSVTSGGTHLAGGAVHAAQSRPIAASGLLTALLVLLARGPLLSLLNRLLGRGARPDTVHTGSKLTHDENFTITAPVLDATEHRETQR